VADPGFSGIAVIGKRFPHSLLLDSLATPDADPYVPGEAGPDGNGVNWWQNQNVCFVLSSYNSTFTIRLELLPLCSKLCYRRVGDAGKRIRDRDPLASRTGNEHH
jgi:hypothetical protein